MRTSLLLLTLFLAACSSTVTPATVPSHQASFDGNEQTSGILSRSPAGYVVTPHFRARYDALVELYGRDFKPAVTAGAGFVRDGSGNWIVDRQHMAYFLEMNAWRRAGLHPANP